MTIVHSTPKEPKKWHYLSGITKAVDNFPYFNTNLCFVGHSHRPIIVEIDREKNIRGGKITEMKIKPSCRYIINDGSIGQPRDGNSNGAYCLYDSEMSLVKIIRFPYNIRRQQEKMEKVGLPEYLIDRIAHGN